MKTANRLNKFQARVELSISMPAPMSPTTQNTVLRPAMK